MKRLFETVLHLGVTPQLPLEDAIAVRTTNTIAWLLMIVSANAAVFSYFDVGSTRLAVLNAIFLLIYGISYLLNGSRLFDAARFTILCIGCVHYFVACTFLGAGSGMEFYTICFAFFPIIIFTKNERRKLFAAFGLIAAAVVITFVFIHTNKPLATTTPDVLARTYNVTFITITAIILGMIGYYHSSSVTARVNLDDQNKRIEEILANVLPQLIAERLKESDSIIAESHGEASVLFADLVGFSVLSKRLSPTHVVDILNAIFTRMDELADRYGVEKIKTIGDCYMAASGVLSKTEGQVEAIADFALALPEVVREVAEQTNYPLDVRVGISTGAVISGVIGTNKYSFDLWGDTVNLANGMEESGVKGRIQVSEATYWRLQTTHELERRGEIDIKGKFKETAYFLRGRKPDGGALDRDGAADAAAAEPGAVTPPTGLIH